jgi:hypothetical protein
MSIEESKILVAKSLEDFIRFLDDLGGSLSSVPPVRIRNDLSLAEIELEIESSTLAMISIIARLIDCHIQRHEYLIECDRIDREAYHIAFRGEIQSWKPNPIDEEMAATDLWQIDENSRLG